MLLPQQPFPPVTKISTNCAQPSNPFQQPETRRWGDLHARQLWLPRSLCLFLYPFFPWFVSRNQFWMQFIVTRGASFVVFLLFNPSRGLVILVLSLSLLLCRFWHSVVYFRHIILGLCVQRTLVQGWRFATEKQTFGGRVQLPNRVQLKASVTRKDADCWKPATLMKVAKRFVHTKRKTRFFQKTIYGNDRLLGWTKNICSVSWRLS